MTVEYGGSEFDLQPASDGLLFGRSGNRELHIAPQLVADLIKRGIMIVKTTTPRDEHDPGEVVGATCEHCHTEFARKPPERDCPRCMRCGATGCPECFHHGQFDHCDMCDDVICKMHYVTVYGSRCCPKEKCQQDAREIAEAARRTAREYQLKRHPKRRSA